jgi:hypothetical protein
LPLRAFGLQALTLVTVAGSVLPRK